LRVGEGLAVLDRDGARQLVAMAVHKRQKLVHQPSTADGRGFAPRRKRGLSSGYGVVNVSCACQGNLRDALTGGGVEDVLQARSSWSSLDTSNAVTESREPLAACELVGVSSRVFMTPNLKGARTTSNEFQCS
jgi:hypothetical protein